MRVLLPATLLLLLLTAQASGGTLAPAKASQSVVLCAGCRSNTCGIDFADRIDGIINGDGTVSAFNIPTGQVLVVTGVDWVASGAANKYLGMFLEIETSTDLRTIFSDGGLSDGSGFLLKSSLAPGVVVKSGPDLCLRHTNATWVGTPIVHGFLTKDN